MDAILDAIVDLIEPIIQSIVDAASTLFTAILNWLSNAIVTSLWLTTNDWLLANYRTAIFWTRNTVLNVFKRFKINTHDWNKPINNMAISNMMYLLYKPLWPVIAGALALIISLPSIIVRLLLTLPDLLLELVTAVITIIIDFLVSLFELIIDILLMPIKVVINAIKSVVDAISSFLGV